MVFFVSTETPTMDGGNAQAPWTPTPITSGEWAGWMQWSGDPFELHAGPFYTRREADGRLISAFRAEAKHMNGGGFMHGGCLMTFADYALFAIADGAIAGTSSVTASFNSEFIDAVREGEIVEGSGEVVRAGRSLVFVRGLLTAGGRPVLTFSAIIKKTPTRPAP